uniref:Transposase Tc1-like domain-containing protein n=1 Tax=Stegastes partitus TaxID=144197 RepID=A0A3B4YXX1_9TELE
MPKTKELFEATKAAILALLEIGLTQHGTTKLLTSRDLKNETIRNRLHEAGLKSHRAQKKLFINKRQRKARLLFAGDHKDWSVDDLDKVLFCDESNFQLMPTSANLLVRRKPGEAYKPDYVAPAVKHGGGSVTFWGCFSMGGTGQMQLCEGLLPSLKPGWRTGTFQPCLGLHNHQI